MKHKTTQPKIRSQFSSGMKLGHQIHTPKKGPGSYRRDNRISE